MKAMTSNYLSVHIFYNVSDLRAILLECIEPLVRSLQQRGMIERYFVIRYWEGGAHVRLRLLPREPYSREDLQAEVDPAIAAFLEQRPALFDPDPEVMAPLMRTLYVMEYGEEAYETNYGGTGTIPLRPNNSLAYIPYVPEYARYGGLFGVEMSERHFEEASDIAFDVLRETNSTLRNQTLGTAFQLMLHFAYAFFQDRAAMAAFFRRYSEVFQGFAVSPELQEGFGRVFSRQAARITEQFAQLDAIHERLRSTDAGALSRYVRSALWIREQAGKLHEEGRLDFGVGPVSFEQAANRLLTSYLHMTNNRLGVLIVEEVYMAHLIVRALEAQP